MLGVNPSSGTEFNKLFLKISREESACVHMPRANPTGTSHSVTTWAYVEELPPSYTRILKQEFSASPKILQLLVPFCTCCSGSGTPGSGCLGGLGSFQVSPQA